MYFPNFYMMVGLPGSGKSYYAMHELDGFIISSDALRKELWGSEETQGDNNVLFAELHRRIKHNLSAGFDTIFDATNLSYKKRKAFLEELKHIPCKKICVFMATPYEKCIENNNKRDRKVPEPVIKRMVCQFNSPYWYEGWDDIQIVMYNDDETISKMYPYQYPESVRDYEQDSDYHSLSLGDHSALCADKCARLGRYQTLVWNAAFIHDCGKPLTKDFHNSKGEESTTAHYYNHQFVSAYNVFQFAGLNSDEYLYIAQLVQWHMHPYTSWKDSFKAMERDKNMLGDQLFNDIQLLHRCDVGAH